MPTKKKYDQIIMGCLFTGIHDVNRNTILKKDDFSIVKEWADSIAALNLRGLIFHNNFSAETCLKFETENIHFIQVKHDATFNPNVYRYFIYKEFLEENKENIKDVFCTDISDVVLLKNPFEQSLFLSNPNKIFCGDEPKKLNDEWMRNHAGHLRKSIADYVLYEEKFKNEVLLNCGIIGGNVAIMQQFIGDLANIHTQYNHDNETAFTGDMGAFNYLARTKYNGVLCHGKPINTEFKDFDKYNSQCWFSHK